MLRAFGLAILLFVAVYAPASALAAGLHFQLATTVPFVMFLTLITAGVGIRVLAVHTPGGLVRYGFSVPTPKYVVAAVLVCAPVATFVALLLPRAHEAGEFRRRSGSLIPAALCHAFFNLAGIIWP